MVRTKNDGKEMNESREKLTDGEEMGCDAMKLKGGMEKGRRGELARYLCKNASTYFLLPRQAMSAAPEQARRTSFRVCAKCATA